ncbi:hypothetical protein K458DRAFT_113776 [Lentithecium fluviatile CBS 122367]|uniref:Rhodopsin domain-containing protein n=1 Tax=Lentithecium fluviatile CBS 122367 TaxID=1168545 RepID=A0A6G1IND1_9PLEO|nr:hypothetical protein K458DRAFT_113776 [Lentithecium fluviatile CBS 122367]
MNQPTDVDSFYGSFTPSVSATIKPAISAPPGSQSHLEDPQNVLWEFNIIAQTVCMTVAGTLFFLRCYVRLGFSRMPRSWALEDWMVTLSFFGLTVYSALMGVMMERNGGVHLWDLTQDQAEPALYYFWIETIIYGPFIFFTKYSILLLYLRLLVPTRWSPLWTTIHIFIGIAASFYVSLTLVKIWQCHPMERAWKKQIPGACINLPVLLQVSGLFNTISDGLILLVPIKACWKLKMSVGKKVAVCAVFTIGAVAPIFSALGFSCRVRTAKSADSTYNDPQILLWATAEITTGVICSCLPALPPLIRKPRKLSTTTTTSRTLSGPRNSGSNGSWPQTRHLRCGPWIELEDRKNEVCARKAVPTVGRAGRLNESRRKEYNGHGRSHAGDGAAPEAETNAVTKCGIVKTVRIELERVAQGHAGLV